jgi:hypothetical protein
LTVDYYVVLVDRPEHREQIVGQTASHGQFHGALGGGGQQGGESRVMVHTQFPNRVGKLMKSGHVPQHEAGGLIQLSSADEAALQHQLRYLSESNDG